MLILSAKKEEKEGGKGKGKEKKGKEKGKERKAKGKGKEKKGKVRRPLELELEEVSENNPPSIKQEAQALYSRFRSAY